MLKWLSAVPEKQIPKLFIWKGFTFFFVLTRVVHFCLECNAARTAVRQNDEGVERTEKCERGRCSGAFSIERLSKYQNLEGVGETCPDHKVRNGIKLI